MNKCYKAKDVMNLVNAIKGGYGMTKSAEALLADLQTIDIVRCKERCFAKPTNSENIFWCILFGSYTRIDHYCLSGERMENE